MIEQKNLSDSLKKVIKPFNNGLDTTFWYGWNTYYL